MKANIWNEFITDAHFAIKGLREICKIQPKLLILILLRSIANAFLPFINIYMSALIINDILLGVAFQTLLFLVFITVILNFVTQFLSSTLNRAINILRMEFNNKYQMRLNHKLMSLDYVDIEKSETHNLYQRIKDYREINNGGVWCLLNCVSDLMESAFLIVFSISLTYSLFTATAESGKMVVKIITSMWGSVFLIVVIIINAIVSMRTNSAITKKIYSLIDKMIPFNRIYEYYLEYMSTYRAGKDIRIYNQKNLIRNECLAVFNDAVTVTETISSNQIKYSCLAVVSSVILNMLIYLFVGLKALVGLFGIGSIIQYVGSINQFTSGFTGCANQFVILHENTRALLAYFEFMELPNNTNHGNLQINKTSEDKYEIEFKNVSFIYPGTNNYALKDMNLTIRSGERLAIVGMNGSGKTTMVKLLCGLYTPTEGVITLNGVNIHDYRLEEYISLFSTVFQDFKLLSFSMAENIAADTEYRAEFVNICIEKAGLSERTAVMPKGINTALYRDFEEDGVEISGGEAQKVAIARALYKDAPFLVLDEPTAALDPVAEHEIYSRFNQIVTDKTVIYISHRLASCRFCDNIIVFDKGKLVQQGNHKTLFSETAGKYRTLWDAQAQYYV